jgi:hypothetical protein
MGGAFKIGRLSGIDVKVHWTFFAFIGYRERRARWYAHHRRHRPRPIAQLAKMEARRDG